MTNLELDLFRAKYTLEYSETPFPQYKITFKSSNYKNSFLTITKEAMKMYGKDVIDKIIYLDAKEFHDFVEEL